MTLVLHTKSRYTCASGTKLLLFAFTWMRQRSTTAPLFFLKIKTMKILGKFKDYYDVVHGNDSDNRIVYHRRPRLIEVNRYQPQYASLVHMAAFRSRVQDIIPGAGRSFISVFAGMEPSWTTISVCGKMYPVLRTRDSYYRRAEEYNWGTLDHGLLDSNLSPMGYAGDFVRAWKNILQEEIERTPRKYSAVSPRTLAEFLEWAHSPAAEKALNSLQELMGTPLPDQTMHVENNTPVLLAFRTGNPKYFSFSPPLVLADIPLEWVEMHKVVDPYTMYQEIETYMGNVLVQPDIAPCTVGSDEIIAQQKGFDKHSFRTQAPGQKKLNRAQNRARKRGKLKEDLK